MIEVREYKKSETEKAYEKTYEIKGRTLCYIMPKEIDQHVAQTLCKELDMLIESFAISHLELDFSNTEFMDSSGIGVVIGRSKTMRFRSGKLAVSHLSDRIGKLFQTTGLTKLVEVKEEV